MKEVINTMKSIRSREVVTDVISVARTNATTLVLGPKGDITGPRPSGGPDQPHHTCTGAEGGHHGAPALRWHGPTPPHLYWGRRVTSRGPDPQVVRFNPTTLVRGPRGDMRGPRPSGGSGQPHHTRTGAEWSL
ncbi:hypothetical protein J6590_092327 [Homalodisca vitripennis]|nr:hypothetical protein J6590_092327 [Homalodisca vitripennis]